MKVSKKHPRAAAVVGASLLWLSAALPATEARRRVPLPQEPPLKLWPQHFPKELPEKAVAERLRAASEKAAALGREQEAALQERLKARLGQLPGEATKLSEAMQQSEEYRSLQDAVRKALDTPDPWPQVRELEAAYRPQAEKLARQLSLDLTRLSQTGRPVGSLEQVAVPEEKPREETPAEKPARPPVEPRSVVLQPPLMSLRQRSRASGAGVAGHSVRLDEATGNFNAEAWNSTFGFGGMGAVAEFDAGFVTSVPPGYRRAEVVATIRPQNYDLYATAVGFAGNGVSITYMLMAGDAFGSAEHRWDDYNRYHTWNYSYLAQGLATGSESRTAETVVVQLPVAVRPEGQLLTLMLRGAFSSSGGGLGGSTSRLRIDGRIESVAVNLFP